MENESLPQFPDVNALMEEMKRLQKRSISYHEAQIAAWEARREYLDDCRKRWNALTFWEKLLQGGLAAFMPFEHISTCDQFIASAIYQGALEKFEGVLNDK